MHATQQPDQTIRLSQDAGSVCNPRRHSLAENIYIRRTHMLSSFQTCIRQQPFSKKLQLLTGRLAEMLGEIGGPARMHYLAPLVNRVDERRRLRAICLVREWHALLHVVMPL